MGSVGWVEGGLDGEMEGEGEVTGCALEEFCCVFGGRVVVMFSCWLGGWMVVMFSCSVEFSGKRTPGLTSWSIDSEVLGPVMVFPGYEAKIV